MGGAASAFLFPASDLDLEQRSDLILTFGHLQKVLLDFVNLLEQHSCMSAYECKLKKCIKRCQILTEAGLALTSQPVSSGTLFRTTTNRALSTAPHPMATIGRANDLRAVAHEDKVLF